MRCYPQLSRTTERRYRSHPQTVGPTPLLRLPVNENLRQRTHFFPTTIPDRDSLYSYFEDSEMADTYRITPQGPEFMVSQNAGVTVGVYNTEQEAQVAVEAHMRLHHIDRRSAHDWIREASD